MGWGVVVVSSEVTAFVVSTLTSSGSSAARSMPASSALTLEDLSSSRYPLSTRSLSLMPSTIHQYIEYIVSKH